MRKRKVEIDLNDEKGSGLVLALMVLLVLSVLGASLGVVTIGSLQLSDANRDTNSAYYIAEAGANMAYDKFEEIVKEASEQESKDLFFWKINEEKEEINNIGSKLDFEPQFGDYPEANVTIREPDSEGDPYIIEATGEVAGKKRTVKKPVTVTWVAPPNREEGTLIFQFPEIPEDTVFIATKKIDNKNGTKHIEGKAYIINDNNAYKYDGDLKEKGSVTYSKGDKNFSEADDWDFDNVWEVPDIPESTQSKVDWTEYDKYMEISRGKGAQTIDLSNLPNPLKGQYKKEKLIFNKDYTFEVGSNDVIIFVEEIDFKSSMIKVNGTGSLTFVVEEDIEIKSGSTVRAHLISKNNVQVKNGATVIGDVFAKDKDVTVDRGGKITGNIYAKNNAEIKGSVNGNITSADDVNISGTVIGHIQLKDDIKISGTVTGNIFAKDEVEISGTVTGNIVGEDIQVSGTVTGDLISRDDVYVKSSGWITGNILAKDYVQVDSSGRIEGNILAGDVKIKSAGVVYGHIVSGDDVELEEGAAVYGIILAKDDVEISKNAAVYGSIVSEDIEYSGTVEYKHYTLDDIIIGSGASTGQSNGVDREIRITTEPALESD